MKTIKEYFKNLIKRFTRHTKPREIINYNETTYIRRRRNAIYITSLSKKK